MLQHKLFYLLLALLFLFPPGRAYTQEAPISPQGLDSLQRYEDTLSVLAYMMINDEDEERRFVATRKMIRNLVSALRTPNSFAYTFPKLKSISFQYPVDSTFRIITWQLYVDKDTYRHYGAIQMNTSELQLYPLIDRSFEVESPQQQQLSNERWYGALYYDIRTLNPGEADQQYLLMGYDGHSFFRRQKILDVLQFVNGKPVFGAPIIPGPDNKMLQRRIIQYAALANVRLTYDEGLDMIILDHLISMEGQYNEGKVNVPDGSYEGYQVKDGKLNYVPKVFDQVSEEAPREVPVLDGGRSGKDLMGREKGKGGNR